jgi:hypothetical protein
VNMPGTRFLGGRSGTRARSSGTRGCSGTGGDCEVQNGSTWTPSYPFDW